MKKLLFVVALAGFGTARTPAAATLIGHPLVLVVTADAASRAPKFEFEAKAYATAIAKAEAGSPDVDYLWLRRQCSAQLSYAEASWKDWQKADKLADTDPTESLRLARERMSGVWTDFLPHIVAQIALEKLGKPDEAMQQAEITRMIVRSISDGHKGTSAEDAFNAVSVAEEYRTLALLRFKNNRQALINRAGHSYDMFTVTDMRSQATREVWFNIDVFFGKEFGL